MGDPSRWDNERELEWIALRPELVVEVTFDHVSNDRIRHGTKVSRWRDDKDPRTAGRSSSTNCVSHALCPFTDQPARLRQRVPRAEDDGLTLVDTMTPARRQDGSSPPPTTIGAPIVRIALTHAHGDHIGSLDALAAALPERRGADLRARRAAAREGQDARPRRAAVASCAAATPARRRSRRARSRPATASARSR